MLMDPTSTRSAFKSSKPSPHCVNVTRWKTSGLGVPKNTPTGDLFRTGRVYPTASSVHGHRDLKSILRFSCAPLAHFAICHRPATSIFTAYQEIFLVMDIVTTGLDILCAIAKLRTTIRRQRHENNKAYVRLMVIHTVVFESAHLLEGNTILQRTKAIGQFIGAANKFLEYLTKWSRMHRLHRLFKSAIMEEERLAVVAEIHQLVETINFATSMSVLQMEKSMENLLATRKSCKLPHDQMQAEMAKQRDVVVARRIAERESTRLLEPRSTFVEVPAPTNSTILEVVHVAPLVVQPVGVEQPVEVVNEPLTMQAQVASTVEENPIEVGQTPDSLRVKSVAKTVEEPVVQSNQAIEEEQEELVEPNVVKEQGVPVEFKPTHLDTVVEDVQLDEPGELTQSDADILPEEKDNHDVDEEAKHDTEDGDGEVSVDEKEDAIQGVTLAQQISALDDLPIPLLIELLSFNKTTEMEKEQALLALVHRCVTHAVRIEVGGNDGISALARLVQESENFFTQLYALHCLSWFTFEYSQMPESEFATLRNFVRETTEDEIVALLNELQHSSGLEKEFALIRSSCMATRGDRDKLRRSGILSEVVRSLAGGTENDKLWAAEVLATVSGDDGSCAIITREGAIPMLVALLQYGTDLQKHVATRVLGNLAARNADIRNKIGQEGGIPLMVASLRTSGDVQNPWAEYALAMISLNNETNSVAIAKEGAIKPLVVLLRMGTPIQQEWSAYTLGNLASVNNSYRDAIKSEGAISPLLNLLLDGTDMQKLRAEYALGRLVCRNEKLDGPIRPLVELLRTGPESEKQAVANMVGKLAESDDVHRDAFGSKGAIEPLVDLLRTGTDGQKQSAAFALGCLANNNEANATAIANQEGASRLLQLLSVTGTEGQKAEATRAREHIAAASTKLLPDITPIVGYVTTQTPIVASAARSTFENVYGGVIPFFQRFAKTDDGARSKSEPATPRSGFMPEAA